MGKIRIYLASPHGPNATQSQIKDAKWTTTLLIDDPISDEPRIVYSPAAVCGRSYDRQRNRDEIDRADSICVAACISGTIDDQSVADDVEYAKSIGKHIWYYTGASDRVTRAI
jgi:hypothetical protein